MKLSKDVQDQVIYWASAAVALGLAAILIFDWQKIGQW